MVIHKISRVRKRKEESSREISFEINYVLLVINIYWMAAITGYRVDYSGCVGGGKEPCFPLAGYWIILSGERTSLLLLLPFHQVIQPSLSHFSNATQKPTSHTLKRVASGDNLLREPHFTSPRSSFERRPRTLVHQWKTFWAVLL